MGTISEHLIMPWQPRVREGQRRRPAGRLYVELHEAAQTTPALPQGRSKEKSSNHPSRLRQKTITQAGTKGSQGLSPSGHLPQQPSLHQSPLPANPLRSLHTTIPLPHSHPLPSLPLCNASFPCSCPCSSFNAIRGIFLQ